MKIFNLAKARPWHSTLPTSIPGFLKSCRNHALIGGTIGASFLKKENTPYSNS